MTKIKYPDAYTLGVKHGLAIKKNDEYKDGDPEYISYKAGRIHGLTYFMIESSFKLVDALLAEDNKNA